MTELKGRHLGFLALLCATWIAARVATNLVPVGAPAKAIVAITAPVRPAQAFSYRLPAHTKRAPVCCNPKPFKALEPRGWRHAASLTPSITFPLPVLYPSAEPAVPARKAANPFRLEAAPAVPPRRKLAASIYAYSFWRFQAPGQGLATDGQYGGSQSGLIATIGFARDAPPQLVLLLRTAIAHDNLRDREFAVGARWQPKTDWPLSVTAERRLRGVGPDSFALYLAGGRGDIRLPARFRLETYAQAGVVSGKSGGHFFDAQATADRRILPQAPLPVFVGAGIWTGGQRGTTRLDIGPSLRTEIPLGALQIRLTADWRFRIRGNAAPGNGPALTLSTGF